MPDTHQVSYGIRLEARTVRHSPLGDTTHAGPSSLWSTPASGIQHPRRRHQAAASDSRTSPPRSYVNEDAVSSRVIVIARGPGTAGAPRRLPAIKNRRTKLRRERKRERDVEGLEDTVERQSSGNFGSSNSRKTSRRDSAGYSRRDAFALVYIFFFFPPYSLR